VPGQYYYAVSAFNNVGESPRGMVCFNITSSGVIPRACPSQPTSPSASSQPAFQTATPSAPVSVEALAGRDSLNQKVVTVKWQSTSSNQTGFHVYKERGSMTLSSGQMRAPFTVTSDKTSVTIHIDDDIGILHCYWVAAYNAEGDSSLSGPVCTTLI
jgi:hypothetical protein